MVLWNYNERETNGDLGFWENIAEEEKKRSRELIFSEHLLSSKCFAYFIEWTLSNSSVS